MPQHDWTKLKTEYVTSDISLRKLAEKYGIRQQTVFKKSKEQGWVEARKKHVAKVGAKAVTKIANQQANELAKELAIADKISNVLQKALDDAEQFNRYVVETRTQLGDAMIQETEERVFQKVDMRALKDAASALKMVEEMKRSMANIMKPEQINREKREARKLELEEERLNIQKDQLDLSKPDKDIRVIIEGYEDGWDE